MSSRKKTKSKTRKKSPKRSSGKKPAKASKPRSSRKCPNIIYFDNNGTTLIAKPVLKTMNDWMSCYNASTDSFLAKPAKAIIQKAIDGVLSHCEVSSATHTVVFTSGATESNCFIIRACVKAFKKKLREKDIDMLPHIVSSAVEHPSIMDCLNDLHTNGEIDVTFVKPTIYGNIVADDVEAAIQPNTCLVTVMYANNEIPVINNINAIVAVTKKKKIPIHCDAVQIFGKYKINMKKVGMTSLAASAHKFYGPKGTGILIIDKKLVEGYHLTAEVNGSQQGGLRGGTLNVPSIVSMLQSIKHAFTRRKKKTKKLAALRARLLDKLNKEFTVVDYENYLYPESREPKDDEKKKGPVEPDDLELVSLGPPEDEKAFILPNTVLLAICKNRGKPFCNVMLKKYLDRKKIIISVGSACSTDKKKASHVLTAIGAPDVVKRGVIRISFGDDNTAKEVDVFVSELKKGIEAQCKDLKKR